MKRAAISFTFNTSREGIEAHLGEMELKIERLRSMYESYFMGMEKMPPNSLRRDMNRMMLEMQQVPIGNASLRFRMQALTQKWVLHTTYWNRTLREIEAGTCRRDMARAQRHLAERGGVITEEEAIALGIPKNRVRAFVARQQQQALKKTAQRDAKAVESHRESAAASPTAAPAAPAAPSTATPPTAAPAVPSTAAPAVPSVAVPAPPPATAPARSKSGPPPIPAYARRSQVPEPAGPSLPGLSEPDFDKAYEHYVAAYRQLGTAEAPSKDVIRTRLGKQLPRVLAEQRCDRVRIEVAVENGKVRLRAWPADGKPAG